MNKIFKIIVSLITGHKSMAMVRRYAHLKQAVNPALIGHIGRKSMNKFLVIISFVLLIFSNSPSFALEETPFNGKLICKSQAGLAVYDDLKTQDMGFEPSLTLTIDKNLELLGLNPIGDDPFKLAYSIIEKHFHKYLYYGKLGWGPVGEVNILMQEYEDETLIGLIITKGLITDSGDRRLKMRNTFWECRTTH